MEYPMSCKLTQTKDEIEVTQQAVGSRGHTGGRSGLPCKHRPGHSAMSIQTIAVCATIPE